jgi:hypothetical protein
MQEFGRNANDRLSDFVNATTLEKLGLVMWLGFSWLRVGSIGGIWQFLSEEQSNFV